MANAPSGTVESLLEAFGDALRAVGEFQQDDYEILYLRDDVREQYSADELHQIWRDMILESLRKDPLENQFPAGGSYDFSATGFENMMVFLFPESHGAGFLLSLDREYVSELNQISDTVHAALETERDD